MSRDVPALGPNSIVHIENSVEGHEGVGTASALERAKSAPKSLLVALTGAMNAFAGGVDADYLDRKASLVGD